MERRKYFTFYRSFREAIQDLSGADKLMMYEAITAYALDQEEPQLTGIASTLFKLIKPNLDSSLTKWKNGSKGGAPVGVSNNPNGRRGKVRTNQELTENKPRTNQELSNKGERNKEKGIRNKENKEEDNIISVAVASATTSKQKSLEDREKAFRESLQPYIAKYGAETIENFFMYWSEANRSHTKMKFEQQSTWDVSRRLARWASREQPNKRTPLKVEKPREPWKNADGSTNWEYLRKHNIQF